MNSASHWISVKRLWIISLVALVGICANAARSAEPIGVVVPTTASSAILADDNGAISEVLLHFSEDEGFGIREVLSELLTKLNPHTSVVIACPNRSTVDVFEAELGAKARHGGRHVRVFNVGMDISIWARDRCIARQNPDGSQGCLLVPRPLPTFDLWRLNELYTPFALESVGAFPDARAVSVIIEGGNIVSNTKFAFVGANVFEENEDAFGNPNGSARLMRDLRKLAGKEIIIVGSELGEVPWNHVDMYLTPVAEKTVLLADPALAAQIMGVDSFDFSVADEEEEQFTSPVDTNFIFAQIAQRLRQSGFVVISIPAVLNPAEQWMMTYNNVLIDEREGKRTVYLPTYGVDALDAYAQGVYEQIGFHVETVNVSGIFESGGALRCVTNVTHRDYKKINSAVH